MFSSDASNDCTRCGFRSRNRTQGRDVRSKGEPGRILGQMDPGSFPLFIVPSRGKFSTSCIEKNHNSNNRVDEAIEFTTSPPRFLAYLELDKSGVRKVEVPHAVARPNRGIYRIRLLSSEQHLRGHPSTPQIDMHWRARILKTSTSYGGRQVYRSSGVPRRRVMSVWQNSLGHSHQS